MKERAWQHRTPRSWKESSEPLRSWTDLDSNTPHLAMSEDGVPLVLHVPNAIQTRGRVSFNFFL